MRRECKKPFFHLYFSLCQTSQSWSFMMPGLRSFADNSNDTLDLTLFIALITELFFCFCAFFFHHYFSFLILSIKFWSYWSDTPSFFCLFTGGIFNWFIESKIICETSKTFLYLEYKQNNYFIIFFFFYFYFSFRLALSKTLL